MANNVPSIEMQKKLEEIAELRARTLEKDTQKETGKKYNCSPYISYINKNEAKITFTTIETGSSCTALYEITGDGRWRCRHDWND